MSNNKKNKKNVTPDLIVEVTPQGVGDVFKKFGTVVEGSDPLWDSPERVKLVILTGGADICPALYRERPGTWTNFNIIRDAYELQVWHKLRAENIPVVGICRGAQLMCAMTGGRLVQDITGHQAGGHGMTTDDGRNFGVSSSHHQMQLPTKDAKVLAWSTNKLSKVYLNGYDTEMVIDKEIEVVHYPKVNGIGIQYHPEWMTIGSQGVKYAQELVDHFLLGNTPPAIDVLLTEEAPELDLVDVFANFGE